MRDAQRGLKKTQRICARDLLTFRSRHWDCNQSLMKPWGSLAKLSMNSRWVFSWLMVSMVSWIWDREMQHKQDGKGTWTQWSLLLSKASYNHWTKSLAWVGFCIKRKEQGCDTLWLTQICHGCLLKKYNLKWYILLLLPQSPNPTNQESAWVSTFSWLWLGNLPRETEKLTAGPESWKPRLNVKSAVDTVDKHLPRWQLHFKYFFH